MNQDCSQTELSNEATCGLGVLRIQHPPCTFPVSPASRVSLRAIGTSPELLSGTGIDWGSGTGILSIAAARIRAVAAVYGLDIVQENVAAARESARLNGVDDKTAFFHADSFSPFDKTESDRVKALNGQVQFILANPPSSDGDDGFDFRRRVLRESSDFLVDGGLVFLSISLQYGQRRIASLTDDVVGFTHGGVLATTDWVPFLNRPDLVDCLKAYVTEEQRGGLNYTFALADDLTNDRVNARTAMEFYERTGQSPLSKWQTHLFAYRKRLG